MKTFKYEIHGNKRDVTGLVPSVPGLSATHRLPQEVYDELKRKLETMDFLPESDNIRTLKINEGVITVYPSPKFEDILKLSQLVLRLGRTYRATKDKDLQPESDTTHSLMLALLARAFCEYESIPLNITDVVVMALLHDLAEAITGDVDTTIPLDENQAEAKEQAEEQAINTLLFELRAFEWACDYLRRYQLQECPESRFVRFLDKLCPKLLHAGNGFASLKARGLTKEDMVKLHSRQLKVLGSEYPEMTYLIRLFRDTNKKLEGLDF